MLYMFQLHNILAMTNYRYVQQIWEMGGMAMKG